MKCPNSYSLFESLENRQLLSAVPLTDKIKIAMLTDTNGEALNSSRITVRFSEAITLSDVAQFRMFGYGINPASASGTAQEKVTINLLNLRAGSDGNKIVFETDRRVRKGARFFIYDGAIKNTSDNSNIGEQLSLLPKGLNKERFTLSSRAFKPMQVSRFSQSVYSNAANPVATPNEPSAQSVLNDLTAFLDAKVSAGTIDSAKKQFALDQFNNATNQSTVPSANLRAAIVSLVGTVAEPAITNLMGTDNVTAKRYTVIDFSTEVSGSTPIAETKGNPDTGRLRTLLKTSYKGESFQALSATLAHESLHQDLVGSTDKLPNSQNEEIFAVFVESVVWAQQLQIQPSLANAGTQLVQSQNTFLLSLLNSGTALFPRVGLNEAPILGGNVFPNGDAVTGGDYTSFENYVRRIYAARNFDNSNTTGNPLALQVKNNIRQTNETAAVVFSTTPIDQFDNSQQIITDRLAVQLAAAMKLQVSK